MPYPELIGNLDDAPESVAMLYDEFCHQLKDDEPLRFKEKPVVFDNRPGKDGYEEGFWHLITSGDPRTFDVKRSAKIGWVANFVRSEVDGLEKWHYLEGSGSYRQYLWSREKSYLVILEERKETVFLVTAFHVETWKVRELDKKKAAGHTF